jgi:hypothetical protein
MTRGPAFTSCGALGRVPDEVTDFVTLFDPKPLDCNQISAHGDMIRMPTWEGPAAKNSDGVIGRRPVRC